MLVFRIKALNIKRIPWSYNNTYDIYISAADVETE